MSKKIIFEKSEVFILLFQPISAMSKKLFLKKVKSFLIIFEKSEVFISSEFRLCPKKLFLKKVKSFLHVGVPPPPDFGYVQKNIFEKSEVFILLFQPDFGYV